MKQVKSSRGSLIATFLLVALAAVGWLQRSWIFDTVRLYNYTPPAVVTQLAAQTTMKSDTKRMFYAYHPVLEDKGTFNTHCTDSEKTIVLGCYISGRGIYLYDVTDPRLNGVEQVTAAHETLHAAYQRLGSKDRAHVNAMIQSAYAGVTDERIRSTIDEYKKNGADTTNELHSILGTEVRNLPPDLEAYYSRYFTDRKAIVAFSEQYESEFTNREKQRADFDTQLEGLKQQIDSLSAGLDSRQKQIQAEYQTLSGLKRSGNISAYNDGVAPYNRDVNGYNADVNKVQSMIKQYNDIVEKRNALVLEEGELLKAIDSRPSEIQQQ